LTERVRSVGRDNAEERKMGSRSKVKAPKNKKPVFFKKPTEGETDEQRADAICDALLPIVNEERRGAGLPTLE